ncbi:MAG: hypothetical protein LQ348_007225 [Seirophora lacunosa]|nr:MAG: hypothetical protein LQ348_007225 [Seirophora lacunosa]
MSHMNRKRAEAGVVFPRLDASNEKTEANMHDVTTMGTARGDDEPPPDGGYGWAYGVYLSHYLRYNSFPGADSLDFAFVGGSSLGAATLVAPVVTLLARKFGTRPPMFGGVVALAGGFIAASFASKAWHLYLCQGVLVGVGVGFIYIPSIAILSQWFSKRRSLANGITAAGSGIGGVLFSLITGSMIENISLAWSLRITGIIAFVMTFIAVVLTRDRNKIIQPAQRPFDTKLLSRKDVWLLLLWAFVSMLGYVTILYSLPDFAQSIGLSRTQATHVVTFLNLGTALGRPLIGFFSDRYGRILVPALLTLICGISCFAIWLPANSFGSTVLFALISGAIIGVFWVASTFLPP